MKEPSKPSTVIGERPIEELWVEEYFGMNPKFVTEYTRVITDYGQVVNLLTMFKEKYASQFKEGVVQKEAFTLEDMEEAFMAGMNANEYDQWVDEKYTFDEWIKTFKPLPNPPKSE